MKGKHWAVVLVLAGLVVVKPIWAGDLNSDGRTDQADLQLLEAYLRGESLFSEEQSRGADENGDGTVTLEDVQLLKKRLNPQATTTPNPVAVVDPTSGTGGRVVDQKTGKPLSGASIEVPQEGIRVTADEEGRFTLPKPLPPNRILTVRVRNYAPFSLTTQKAQRAPFDLRLEQMNARSMILDDQVRHLGDDQFGNTSANAGQLHLAAEGTTFRRTFDLNQMPDQDPYLRIGSIVGIDTPDSVRAGQSQLPVENTFREGPNAAFRVYLNGTLVQRITVNGDSITIPLPRKLLKTGANELLLATASTVTGSLSDAALASFYGNRSSMTDFDDVEFANLVLVILGREERGAYHSSP